MRSLIVPASYVDAVPPANGNKVKVLDASPEEVVFGLGMQGPSICEALLRRNNLALNRGLASESNVAYSNKINILPVSP
jgi:hypothetical protein